MISLRTHKRDTRDTSVPMINVALLLLVFFLMTAVIAPPPPFEMNVPFAATEGEALGVDVFLRQDGSLLLADGRPITDEDIQSRSIVLHTSADTLASHVASVARELSEAGATGLALSATARRPE